MGTRRKVIWSRFAHSTFDDILDYILRESPVAAARFAARTLELAASLDRLALRGRIVPEIERDDVRELFVDTYRILYEVRDDTVVILAVIHGARDFARLQRKN